LSFLKKSSLQQSSAKNLSQSIKNIFGFRPQNLHLYKLAFRHKSVNKDVNGIKINNERLEYLGDAVLGSVIADYLFKKFPYKGEGFLTEMRSKIVCRSNLEKLSRKLGLDKLIESSPEIRSSAKSMRGDAFEAFIGALYLDRGYDFTKKIIIRRVVNIHIDIDNLEHLDTNFKSKLIEWAQKEKKEVDFRVIGEKGEKNQRQYEIEIYVDNNPISKGIDFSIKGAEKIAAEKACNTLFADS
jgi:ribonuclease-3